MPFNVLILPLLGGYIFLILCYRSRYAMRRHSGQQVLFHSATAGTLLLLAAFVIVRIGGSLNTGLEAEWNRLVPFEWSGTSTVAFVLGCLLWWPANTFLFSREREVERAIARSNDFLEALLHQALTRVERVSITTKHDKVYVGFVLGTYDPSFEREQIALLPLFSGFRRRDDRQVEFTTEYLSVYDRLLPGVEVDAAPDRVAAFQTVIPLSQICSANLFDPEAYELFEGRSPAPVAAPLGA